MNRFRRFYILLTLVFLISVAVVACTGQLPSETVALSDQLGSTGELTNTAALPLDPPRLIAAEEGTLAHIYESVSPSVVHIRVVKQETALPDDHPQLDGGPELDLPQAPPQAQGEGSGFVWDKQGHIVTNNHVVENSEKITVIFADDTAVEADLVGADPDSDLAVLSVDLPKAELKPVRLGDSTELRVGELAIAIGNPFGQEGTMTVGIVSALGRLLPVSADNPFSPRYNIPDVIQTDAAINPGNSGGVLLNDQGEVIGVTTAILSAVRASSGVGFAVPSAIVQKVVPALISDGIYNHPFLGISGGTLTPELAEAMDLPADQRGVLVATVIEDGPAEKAGLQGSEEEIEIEGFPVLVGGDVITAVNGQDIEDMDDLIAYLSRYAEVGQELELTLLRDGREITDTVQISARPAREPEEATSPEPAQNEPEERLWPGFFAIPITPEIAEKMNLAPDQTGLLVQQVELDSPADKAGLVGSYKLALNGSWPILVGGDVIVTINDNETTTLDDLQKILEGSEPGDELSVELLRDGEEAELTIILDEPTV